MRIKIIKIFITILFLIIAFNLAYVQGMRGKYYHKLSVFNRIRVVPLEAPRGNISDRNNVLLTDNRVVYNVMVVPQEIKNKEKLFSFLSEALQIDKKKLVQTYNNKKSSQFTPIVLAEDVNRGLLIKVEEEKYRFPGLLIQESFKRQYLLGANSAHVLGYVAKVNKSKLEKLKEYGYSPASNVGYSGVEEYYDKYLRGEEGGVQIEINSRGQQVRLLGLKEPVKGKNIQLTIDSSLQQVISESLSEITGSVIIMDTDTGEILGLENYPSFDPNIFIESQYKEEMVRVLNDLRSPLLNRAIKGVYPPGSVFKVPVAVAALESKKITENTTYLCEGFLEIGGTRFGCTHVHGNQDLFQAIANSCNIYFYRLGLNVGADIISHYAKIMTLGQLTNIDLPYEAQGFIPNRQQKLFNKKKWYSGDTLNMSIGQGDVLVTPLQLVRMMAIIANQGFVVQPHLIKSISQKDADYNKSKRRVAVSQKTFDLIKKGLRRTVQDLSGTAHVLDLPDLYVAGKTGTAQAGEAKESHSWFVGYVDSKKKNITIGVFLEHGGSSQNACLVARQILMRMQEMQIL